MTTTGTESETFQNDRDTWMKAATKELKAHLATRCQRCVKGHQCVDRDRMLSRWWTAAVASGVDLSAHWVADRANAISAQADGGLQRNQHKKVCEALAGRLNEAAGEMRGQA